jgi:hypothetical protein
MRRIILVWAVEYYYDVHNISMSCIILVWAV